MAWLLYCMQITNMSCFSWLHHQWTHRKLRLLWIWIDHLFGSSMTRSDLTCVWKHCMLSGFPPTLVATTMILSTVNVRLRDRPSWTWNVSESVTCFPGCPQLLSRMMLGVNLYVGSWDLRQKPSASLNSSRTRLDMKYVWKRIGFPGCPQLLSRQQCLKLCEHVCA